MKKKLIQYLSEFLTDKRFEIFEKVLDNRTNYITVVLEDLYQPHNASAVLRTCDCFGIQDVHIIENKNKYEVNPDIALGSSKWLNLIKYNKKGNNTLEAIKALKTKGYRIVATTPYNNDIILEDFDLKKGKVALFFGTELQGLSKLMLDNADEFLKIPMFGFTESFNISVSASIILHHLTYKLRNSKINRQINKEEKLDIMLKWLKESIKKSDLLEKEFYKTCNKKNVTVHS
ncbi:MAG: RNA methyltransferase [Bacteroidales bacterium]|nr:RNA methyltransferase [Bacteroidales bacterium]